jgi:hypothetical protein
LRSASGNSPTEASRDWKTRLVPGGNFGLGLGTQWYVDLSPSLGYQLHPRSVAGAGAIFNAYGGTFQGIRYRFYRYGAFLFGRYRLFDSFYASAELEALNVNDENASEAKRIWVLSPLVGGSYIVPFGSRGGIQASLLYNLNYKPYLSPYPSPIVWRLGFFL